jgi:hypothetical protein
MAAEYCDYVRRHWSDLVARSLSPAPDASQTSDWANQFMARFVTGQAEIFDQVRALTELRIRLGMIYERYSSDSSNTTSLGVVQNKSQTGSRRSTSTI